MHTHENNNKIKNPPPPHEFYQMFMYIAPSSDRSLINLNMLLSKLLVTKQPGD